MNEPKTFASLSPALLARKGGARPAMRSQQSAVAQFPVPDADSIALGQDELGWNDLGHADGDDVLHEAEIVTLKPHGTTQDGAIPAVIRQQASIAARITAPSRSAVQRRSALEEGRRAAFTLRLDGDRHLKLRLACTLRNRSAQQLLIDALDQLIDALPDLDSLATQVAGRR